MLTAGRTSAPCYSIANNCYVVPPLTTLIVHDMSTLGTRIREARDAKGWTQEELADELGVAQAFISQIENGRRRPTPALARRLAAALDLSFEELAAREEQADVKANLIHRKLKGLSSDSLEKIEDYVNLVRKAEKGR